MSIQDRDYYMALIRTIVPVIMLFINIVGLTVVIHYRPRPVTAQYAPCTIQSKR